MNPLVSESRVTHIINERLENESIEWLIKEILKGN